MKLCRVLLVTAAALALSGTTTALGAENGTGVYDSQDGAYHYLFSDGTEVTGTVQNGEATSNLVSFTFPDNVFARVKRGEEYKSYQSEQYLVEPGDYTAEFTAKGEILAVSFTIVQMNQGSGHDMTSLVFDVTTLKQSYDEQTKGFLQTLTEGYSFYSSAPQGMVSSGAVLFHDFSGDLVYTLTRDGTDVSYESGQALTENGSYRLRVMLLPGLKLEGVEEEPVVEDEAELTEEALMAAMAEDGTPSDSQLSDQQSSDSRQSAGQSESQSQTGSKGEEKNVSRDRTMLADFCFTIATEPSNRLNTFQAPVDYRITQVLLDGKLLTGLGEEKLVLDQDGCYQIHMTGKEKTLPALYTELIRDTKAPLLDFVGVDERGRAKKSFRMIPSEPNVTYRVTRNGWEIEDVEEEIHFSGLYHIQVLDQAGNSTSYQVQLKDSFGIMVPALIALMLIGTGAAAYRYISGAGSRSLDREPEGEPDSEPDATEERDPTKE